jgi:hypothetical protein
VQTALPSDVDPNSPLAQIIHLAQSGISEAVLTSYASNSPTPFNLTADQIIYLKDIGVPDSVVQAMIQRDQQLGATDNTTPTTQPVPDSTPPTGDVTSDYFYGALAPYGGWVNVAGYGLCWRPSVVVYNSDWQPYSDHGHWVYTDDGWYWISDYSWGWATFHYGRWFHDANAGWCWWPDTQWAPSWVCWRYSDSYCGWAPLPPHSEYRAGVGFVYNGVAVGAGFDFGISANFFTFVPPGHFCDPHPSRFRVDAAHRPAVYHQTVIINNFDVHNNVFVNHGIDPERITRITRTPIHTIPIRESASPVMRGEMVGGNQTLVINRPHFTGTEINNMHQGVVPRENPAQNGSHAWYITRPQPNNYQRPDVNQPNRTEPNQGGIDQNANHPQPFDNNQRPEMNQPSPARQNPQPVDPNANFHQPYYNNQHPQTPQPGSPWTPPRQPYQQPAPSQPQYNYNQPVPEQHPIVNQPVRTPPEPPAQPQTRYPENREPIPQYNNDNSGDRYNSPRSQEPPPQEQTPRESAPAESHQAPPPPAQQQPRQQQGQQQQKQQGQQQWPNKNGN